MGHQPYAVLLPWVFFAVVARSEGEGIVWGSIAAIIAALTLLATSRHAVGDAVNVLAFGALAWFSALAVVGVIYGDNGGWFSHNGRAISAFGYVVIALASIAYRPVTEYYARTEVLPRAWSDPGFARLNVQLTLLWAVTFFGIAVSHVVAETIRIDAAFTLLNWVVPICLCVIAAARAKVYWFDFHDDLEAADDMKQLDLGWSEWDMDSPR